MVIFVTMIGLLIGFIISKPPVAPPETPRGSHTTQITTFYMPWGHVVTKVQCLLTIYNYLHW